MSVRRWFALALVLLARVALAHNLDTSYAKVAIAADHVDLRFTLDLFTLEKIAAVDPNGDGTVTRAELERATPAIVEFVRSHVRLEIDGQSAALGTAAAPVWPPDTGDAIAAKDWHSANALIAFPFRVALARPAHDVMLAFDVFEAFGTRHTVLGVFENRGNTEEVTFTQPEPDYLFDTAYVEGDAAKDAPAPRAEAPLLTTITRFLKLGVEHIFLGYDHICFLLALLVVSRFREMVKIITSFTVAHSITLILAAFGVARMPSRLVECGVALTIVYVAVDNLRRKSTAHRWMLTFAFGLVHGFSFASVLSQLGLPAIGRVRCLLAFNVGVELGQLAIVGATVPLLWMLAHRQLQARTAYAVSLAVALFGVGWFVERAFGLGFMPI